MYSIFVKEEEDEDDDEEELLVVCSCRSGYEGSSSVGDDFFR